MKEVLDGNMVVESADTRGIRFLGADDPQLRLEGFVWRKPGEPFRRLPQPTSARPFTDKLNRLADCSAGGQLLFRSNTRRVVVRAQFAAAHRMARMALTGIMGFDLYVKQCGKWVFRGVTRFAMDAEEYCMDLVQFPDRRNREFLLNFPLIAEVSSFELGVDEDAQVLPPSPWPDARPVVVYGTSIAHGACATRPGNCYPAALSRLLNRPVLNMGFAGNARGERFMAETLAEIPNPALYIVDYDPNSNPDNTTATLAEFIRVLRAAHPETPVLTISKVPYPTDYPEIPGAVPEYMDRMEAIHRRTVGEIRAAGDKLVTFVEGRMLLDTGKFPDFSADGIHLNDAGFLCLAERLAPIAAALIADAK